MLDIIIFAITLITIVLIVTAVVLWLFYLLMMGLLGLGFTHEQVTMIIVFIGVWVIIF
jgi:hypothetical protein